MGNRMQKPDSSGRASGDAIDRVDRASTEPASQSSLSEARGGGALPEIESKFDAVLLDKLRGDPDEVLHCIVMADKGLDRLESEMPASVLVEHRYRLIQSLSVTGAAKDILELGRLDSVRSIESVRPVAAS